MVVVYDSVYGGLHLTENLYDEFSRFIERLSLGAGLSQGNGIVSAEVAEQLATWEQGLSESDNPFGTDSTGPTPPADGNWLQVFKPGSVVGIFVGGNPVEREIIEPTYKDFFNTGTPVLFYSYRNPRVSDGSSFTPADAIQAIGHEWEWVWWNPDTAEYRDLEVSV